VIRHAYPEPGPHVIAVRCTCTGKELVAEVEDDGRPFNPLLHPAPDLTVPLEERPVGGLGIHLVRNLMDSLAYHREQDHNRLVMTKRLANP
jgi:serine/threonine-protein kinase RsbW